MSRPEQPILIVADADAFRDWLRAHGTVSDGVWLVLARKGTTEPTSLTYALALDEALCEGWIDGQKSSRDTVTFVQRFTPRRTGSRWSKRNVDLAEQLTAAGRMRPAGLIEIERAKADGRWAAAYAGPATATVPDDLGAALAANAAASAMFSALSGANRFSVLHRIETAKRPDTRTRRIEHLVAMLARGETIHPQKSS